MSALHDLSAIEIAGLVRAREISAREVTDACLARIAATEGEVNAFIHVADDQARADADAVDRRIAAGEEPGPLVGVPVGVKDMVHVAGMATTFGCKLFAGQVASEDAVPIARLKAAGAVIVGKTTTPEFGHKAMTQGPLFGRTLNPWNEAYTSGGSSGGSGAALAARQVPLTVGTDGGGSVRIPASVCGVFGLKATLGVVPHIHAPDLFANNSYIGPMARDAADLRAMHAVMAGPDERDPWSKRIPSGAREPRREGLKLGFAMRVGNPVVDPEVSAAVLRAREAFGVIGNEVREIDIDLHQYEPHFRVFLETALAGRLSKHLETNRDDLDPTLVRTIEHGLARDIGEIHAAAAVRSRIYRSVDAVFDEVDLLLTPTLAAAGVAADTDTHADIIIAGENAGRIRAGWHPYTWPMNLTGHPAVTLPCGWTCDGIPIGLQIVGRWYEDDLVLWAAQKLHAALGGESRAWIPRNERR